MRTVWSVIALPLVFAAPALAATTTLDDSTRSAQLDSLFQQLKVAPTVATGIALEGQIDAIWLQSGDPKDRPADATRQAGVGQRPSTFDTALKYLNNVIITKPNYAEAWNQRATLYYMVGDYQDSLKDIAQTLALEPRQFGAIAGKGMVELKLGDKQAALDAFKQALVIAPILPDVQLQIRMIEGQDVNGPGERT